PRRRVSTARVAAKPGPLMVTRPRPTARSGLKEVTTGATGPVYRDPGSGIRPSRTPRGALSLSKGGIRYSIELGIWIWDLELGIFRLGLVQLHIPVQVVAPAFRCVPQTDGDPNGRCGVGTPWMSVQAHTRLSRRTSTHLPVAFRGRPLFRRAVAESGRRGCRCRRIPASAGVRPPFFRLHDTQHVTMFSQSLRPPCATGTTWSNVSSDVGNDSLQY